MTATKRTRPVLESPSFQFKLVSIASIQQKDSEICKPNISRMLIKLERGFSLHKAESQFKKDYLNKNVRWVYRSCTLIWRPYWKRPLASKQTKIKSKCKGSHPPTLNSRFRFRSTNSSAVETVLLSRVQRERPDIILNEIG